jgi:hypothetical protein
MGSAILDTAFKMLKALWVVFTYGHCYTNRITLRLPVLVTVLNILSLKQMSSQAAQTL